jgi:pimeloyl-ACP methyl ester carboxylesterase
MALPLKGFARSAGARIVFLCVAVFSAGCFLTAARLAAEPRPLENQKREALEHATRELQAALDRHAAPRSRAWADTAIFAKGLAWALRYDREFTAADVALLEKAARDGAERARSLSQDRPSWETGPGRMALGYLSAVDGSVQPYGVVIPKQYQPGTPIRLDVVLHGSSRPVGMSELRFMARFAGADADHEGPDQPFIELHPLGRVENCYRWSGETDVFEAIEDVCRRYDIDRDRIVLRGMSMGASATWHLGLKYPDRFVALGPYCGYVDTHRFSETPLPSFVRVGPLPWHQELGLHILDSIDYAANAGVVPAVACMGEKDVFFQAHVLMAEAMRREGLTMTNLISPGTGHVIDPQTHAEQMRRIGEFATAGRRAPRELRFVTWTLRYNRCHWMEVLQLDRHYDRAELVARLKGDVLEVDEPRNIARFGILRAQLPASPARVRIGQTEIPLAAEEGALADRIILKRREGRWQIETGPDDVPQTGKQPGLQGPIDDAFTAPFLCVRGTGRPWNAAVAEYAEASLGRFSGEWHQYFRGELPVKDDTAVTESDIQSRNLILFGDPGSNSWIGKILPKLPLEWSKETIRLAGREYSAANHIPALIAPNPLPGAGKHSVVLNSGHTFRGDDLGKFNYLLFPRWGDWALIEARSAPEGGPVPDDHVLDAGYFDERWQFSDAAPNPHHRPRTN